MNPPTLELGDIFLDQNYTFEHFSPWIFFDETAHIDYWSWQRIWLSLQCVLVIEGGPKTKVFKSTFFC